MNNQSLRAKVREETLREVLAVMPAPALGGFDMSVGWNDCRLHTRVAIEALLPKPDRVAELVERWRELSQWEDMGATIAVDHFARWLISEGIVL